MRVAGEAIARQAGIENGDLAAGTAELQGGGEAGKAAADDDDVIHGDGLRVVDGGGWAGPGAKYRPAIRARDGQRAGLRHRRESRPSPPASTGSWCSRSSPKALDSEAFGGMSGRWRRYASQPSANPLLVRTILTAKQGRKRA